ncbi:MAG: class I SAM-dependent methyltransferase [Candidatus Methylumidiphilus sp.]
MPNADIQAKWDRVYAQSQDLEPTPAAILTDYPHLLPQKGQALDLACGLGGNALYLARRGFHVHAWDISGVAVARLNTRANSLGLDITAQRIDVETTPFPAAAFDVVTVSRFLARPLSGPIMASLKPGGLLFYQTYLRDKLSPNGPNNPDYLLAPNELLAMFNTLKVLVYREEGRVGDLSLGLRDEAHFIGQKR